jgi:hypothetical protein
MLRLSEDNDFINIYGNITDDAYTNGTRIDYYYRPDGPTHFFTDRRMPKAGEGSIDIFSWGAAQLMYTPDDLTEPAYQPNDYPWSAALFATHSRFSYNPVRHYDLQTELVLGVIGPAAMGKEMQSLFHKMTRYYQPAGWGNQFRNDLLANVNLTAEKQLLSAGSFLTVIGGAQAYAGTMQNGAAVYPLILIGKHAPYFNGFLSQYTSGAKGRKKWQAYVFAKPEMQLFLSNALLQGGMFTHNPNLQPDRGQTKESNDHQEKPQPYHPLQHWLGTFAYGGVLSYGHIGVSLTQTVSGAMLKGLYCHNYGNISLYVGW